MELAPNLPAQFILYAAIFRLGVIAAGLACVVLGYRLLTKAAVRKGADGALVASAGTTRLELRNLAPGTMFAAFGMIVLAVMLYEGLPELSQQKGSDRVVLRSEAPGTERSDLTALTEKARALEQAGKSPEATEAYEAALDAFAAPANHLAILYLQQGRNAEALGLARIAADLRPFRADILDTLAWACARSGDAAAATTHAARAAQLDPQYARQLDALQRGERR